ncbi:MAG: hypothetical protein DWQ35_17325 [Planctomycetota bacterium]|nr:MAG: hypothetical protein DWQ35_17325 [Planctomycetota bacterium]REK28212.1 MAG: hypothetical protein DWQ42_05710 [Planctomycetota bacterium]
MATDDYVIQFGAAAASVANAAGRRFIESAHTPGIRQALWLFDDSAAEYVDVPIFLSRRYRGGDVAIRLALSATTATAPDQFRFEAAFLRLTAGTNAYPIAGAKITATYESRLNSNARADLPAVPEGTYLTYRADLGSESISIPGRVWRWATGPDFGKLPPDFNPNVVIPSDSFQLTWHRVAAPNWEVLRDLRGKVNSQVFLGAPAGTVLFLGAEISRQFEFVGDDGFWQVDFAFAERAIDLIGSGKAGWNYFFRENSFGGDHWTEVEDLDGNQPYASADLATLFTFATC